MPELRGAVSVLLVAGLLLSACTAAPPDAGGAGGASPSPTTGPGEAHLDLSGLTVPRTDVCDGLGDDDVEQALAGPVADTAHYANGEELEVAPGRVDIAHEHGCVYVGVDGTVAGVWIFARPVAREEARQLVRRARRGRDCAFPESVRFGTPSLTSVCEVPGMPAGQDVPAVRARLEGLFHDTWVGCEVGEPMAALETRDGRDDVVRRAEQWCTDVVTSVSAPGQF